MTCCRGIRISSINFAETEFSIHLGCASGLPVNNIDTKTFCFLQDAFYKLFCNAQSTISIKRIDGSNPRGFIWPSFTVPRPKADHPYRQVGIFVDCQKR